MRRPHRLALAFAAFLWTLPTPSSAGGQAPTPEQVKQAVQTFKEALKRIDAGDFVGAEVKLQDAMKLNPTYDVAVNLGQVEYRLNKYRSAAEHLAFALSNWPLMIDKEAHASAEKRLEELHAFVASIQLTTNVDGAEVTVDGKSIGRTPIAGEIFLEPGSHDIAASMAGYSSAPTHLDLPKGKRQKVALQLTPSAAPSASLVAPPSPSASAPPPVPTGTSTPPAEGPGVGWIVASGLATGVFLGAGLGLTAVAANKHSEAVALGALIPPGGCANPSSTYATNCQQLSDDAKSHDTLATVGTVGFIGGGVLGATTVGLIIWRATSGKAPEKTAHRIQVTPWASPRSSGVHVLGVW